MKYVAFLRGINVGGKNRVEMSRLKSVFESLGFVNVSTYINSGNVIFETEILDVDKLVQKIEEKLTEVFGLYLRVVLRNAKNIHQLCKQIPRGWENNHDQKTDILFLWKEFNTEESVKQIKSNAQVDTLQYFPGAIVWNIKRKNYSKSSLHKFIGTKIYKNMTARNLNTVRKLNELLTRQK